MFGCYRRGDANDPDTYVAAVAAVLSRYDAETIKNVTDPFGGIPSRKTENGWSGLPDVADVKEACEAEASRRARIADLGRYKTKPFVRLPRPPLQGRRANIFVGSNTPQYAAMVKRMTAKETDPLDWRADDKRPGVWVPLEWVNAKPVQ